MSITHESLRREVLSAGLRAERHLRQLRDPIVIPLVGNQEIIINGTIPLTEDAWAGFLAVLYAMKPGLVRAPEPEPVEAAAGDASEVEHAGDGS